MATMEPYNRMVRMVARAFYRDISLEGGNQPKSDRCDGRGIGVVVLDALTRRQWVREEDLAQALKIYSKQLRRILQFFEEEKLVTRCYRKESPKGVHIYSGVSATAGDVQPFTEGREKAKMHTHSYCCLDYAQVYDAVRYRIHRMRKKLKDDLDDRDTVQHYVCPNCKRRYSAFDALQLVSDMDDCFHCEHCKGELLPESEKLAGDNARKLKHDKLKDMQKKKEKQLEPLISQLNRVKDLEFPEFQTLEEWGRNVRALVNAGMDAADPPYQNSMELYVGTPMPILGEAMMQASSSGVSADEEIVEYGVRNTRSIPSWIIRNDMDFMEIQLELDSSGSIGAQEGVASGMESIKPLPPWMNCRGTYLTEEQKGENSNTANLDQSSEAKSDKKQCSEEDERKSVQEAYIKAYYEALHKRQEKEARRRIQEESRECIYDQPFASDAQFERQLGAKSKHDDGGESGDDGIELKVEQPTGEVYKLADLNVETQESSDDDYDIDWEDG